MIRKAPLYLILTALLLPFPSCKTTEGTTPTKTKKASPTNRIRQMHRLRHRRGATNTLPQAPMAPDRPFCEIC